MMNELELLDHLNDTVTRITEDTLLLSLLLDYMDGLSCRPEQVSREISENLLQRLGDSGNTVVVIEHNLDVIKTADHIIDLGPEGGDGGGTIVCTGTPEEVAACERSYTGRYLKKMLER